MRACRHDAGGGEDLSLARAGHPIAVTLRVEAGGTLIGCRRRRSCFDGARLHARIDIELERRRLALIAEEIVFGRTAHRRAIEQGRLRDRWRIRRGGRLIWAEALRLDGAIARDRSRRPVAARRQRASRRSLLVAARTRRACRLCEPAAPRARRRSGASRAWNGFALIAALASGCERALRAGPHRAVLASVGGGPRAARSGID